MRLNAQRNRSPIAADRETKAILIDEAWPYAILDLSATSRIPKFEEGLVLIPDYGNAELICEVVAKDKW